MINKIVFISLFLIFNISCRQHVDATTSSNIQNVQDINNSEYRIGLYLDLALNFNPQKITHIILIGSAVKEDSDQFFQSAISRAHRYKELWPNHQVVLMSGPDVYLTSDKQVFDDYKISVLKTVQQKFTAKHFLNEVSEFDQIASLDFFGHSTPWGLIIGKVNATFDPSSQMEALKKLRPKFLPDAYATLSGCNTGFYLAPDLSAGLAIPVSGSLTSSMFERIESDGHWYKEEDQTHSKYVFNNRFSFNSLNSCSLGLCTRMKSARRNYSSYWGTFSEGGLSFDKFFCNYKNNKNGSCEKGMAKSLLSFPSVHPITLDSSREEFKEVVFDWLCSTGKDKKYFQKCVEGIKEAVENGTLEYQSHPTNELNCDFNSCNAKIICNYKEGQMTPIPETCIVDTIPNFSPKNTANEYLSLIKGFKLLKE